MKKLIVMVATVASVWGLAGAPVAAVVPPPYTLSATVVDADSGRAVKRALVLAIDFDSGAVDLAVTDRNGDFTLDDISGEEFSIVVIGGSRYESGYTGCALDVVATFGEACTFGPDPVTGEVVLTGDIRLDRR